MVRQDSQLRIRHFCDKLPMFLDFFNVCFDSLLPALQLLFEIVYNFSFLEATSFLTKNTNLADFTTFLKNLQKLDLPLFFD